MLRSIGRADGGRLESTVFPLRERKNLGHALPLIHDKPIRKEFLGSRRKPFALTDLRLKHIFTNIHN
jgi:hypothetical protein